MANTENIPIDKLSSKEETTNYCRIILLMVDVGTETLLHLFYSLVPKHTVQGYFAFKKPEIDNGKQKKIFDKSQYSKLTCPNPNPDNFDISLLIKVIKYFKLSSVNLDSLQAIRNEIVGHKCRAELMTQQFESLWIQVENILLNIARCVSGDEERITKLKITELKKKVLDVSEREKKIIKIFEAWYKEEIAVLHEKSDHNQEEIAVLHEKSDHNQEEIVVLHEKSDHNQKEIAVLHEKLDHNQEETAVLHEKSDHNQEEIAVLHEKSDHNQEEIAVLHEKSDHNQEEIVVLHEKSDNNQKQIAVLHKNIQSLHDEVFKVDQQPQSKPNGESAEECKILKMLQQDLIIYYRKELIKLQLSPLFEEEGYAADFFEFYVKPIIRILSLQRSKGQSVTFHDIFNCKSSQNIYISSPAGCGKTAFAKYLTLIWCQAHLPVESNNNSSIEEDNSFIEEDNSSIEEDIMEMQKFMFLFIVFLRDEHEQECDVDSMIQNQLIPKLANSATYTELGLKFVQNLLGNVKCIIILDGLDEWSHPPGNECKLHNKQIPYIRARPLCTTVTTSRPWKLDVVTIKPGHIDQKLEINGLEDVLLQRLIRNVVKKLNELRGKEMQAYKDADEFKQELKYKKLTDLSKIPVVVMQLLTVWFDNESLGESQCEIYSNMIEFLLKRYCKKREMEDMEVDDCNRDRQIPMCLQNNMYCKVYMELLSKLATLAYNTLFTDNEETSLVFDRIFAKKYLTDKEIEMSLTVGILTQEKVLGKISIRQSHISFIHKTFQEYLAALYVALSPGMGTNVEEKIKRVCCSIEKILEMSQIFMFLSGLCPEVMVNLNEHLGQTVSKDSMTQGYRDFGELGPTSREGRTLNQLQDTMVECLGECWLNGHKHVTHLPVSDFFIWSPRKWSAELKSLAVHNPVCTLCVYGNYSPEEIEDILKSVTVFNSIQKLWLSWVSETFVVQLVSQYSFSGWVILDLVEMSGDILCFLVDILPQSVHVRLVVCSISQGTRDWKAYIRSHPQLTVDVDDIDDDSDVSDDRCRNVQLLQFYTNEV